jgi:transcriptional regulator with PAS, ATPase and Fis domain
VVVDCASLHEELLQSELFGHEKGAFSGAARQKHGLFEVAHAGTLFLDEIGDASPEIQSKLLRVLETGRFRRLGGTQEIAVDVRLVAATNRNLQQAIEKGRFREDLYFRLTTVTIEIPPLRERREDVATLVEHFLGCLNRRFSRACRLEDEALELLVRHAWPGNVRELIHVLEGAVVLSEGERIGAEHLPAALRASVPEQAADGAEALEGDPPLSLRDVERRHVLSVLEGVGGNRSRAAQILGISERNLYRLIQRHGWRAPRRSGIEPRSI